MVKQKECSYKNCHMGCKSTSSHKAFFAILRKEKGEKLGKKSSLINYDKLKEITNLTPYLNY